MLFKRSVPDGLKGRIIDALEVPLAVELIDAIKDIPVGLICGANDHLCGLPYGRSFACALIALDEFCDPPHRVEDVALHVFHRTESGHHLGSGRLDVDGQTRAQAVSFFD